MRPSAPPPQHRAIRRRVDIACVHCRQQKIKCRTSEQSETQSCDRCIKKALPCEYLPVCEQQAKASPTSPSREERTSDLYALTPSMSSTWNEYPPNSTEYVLDTGHLAPDSDIFNFLYSDAPWAEHTSSSLHPFRHNQLKSTRVQTSEQPALASDYSAAYYQPPHASQSQSQGSRAQIASTSEVYINYSHYCEDPNLTNTPFPIYTDAGSADANQHIANQII
ncbi:hypothetical protein K438DRAFT_2063145 [Mycena galopus ATCC 62051]|nr:hypothetical protein K438DRAFT_2063145 [Mycena galopus ATCC 62051]